MEIFAKASIGNCILKNRIIRSGTYEGMCDDKGFPGAQYYSLYETLAKNDIGGIITGFAYISKEGKAMQAGQAGIDERAKIQYYKKLTDIVHHHNSKIFLQIAHTGRQTIQSVTQNTVVGCSKKKSIYFRETPKILSTSEIYTLIEKFGRSALYAKESGFDGVQLQAAHGYLIHQFLMPSVNNRNDEFGIDPEYGIGCRFLGLIIDNIREKCGIEFPLLVKISGSDDYRVKFTEKNFKDLIAYLDKKRVDAIEISYGSMDYALNIFRGDFPTELILAKNPFFKTHNPLRRIFLRNILFPYIRSKLYAFSPIYNLKYAIMAKQHSGIPIISVGGYRNLEEIEFAIMKNHIDFVGICRPFIAEPDYIKKISKNKSHQSSCINCNYCAIMCDTKHYTKCYKTTTS